MLIPLVRILAGIAQGPEQFVEQLMPPKAPDQIICLLQAMAACLQPQQERSVRYESLFALSNITGGQNEQLIEPIVKANFIPALVQLLVSERHFFIKREAAFCLFNIARVPAHLPAIFNHKDVLRQYLECLKADDVRLVRASLRMIEFVLKQLPDGRRLVEEADGIEALEYLQRCEDRQDEYDFARALVDKYLDDVDEDVPDQHQAADSKTDTLSADSSTSLQMGLAPPTGASINPDRMRLIQATMRAEIAESDSNAGRG